MSNLILANYIRLLNWFEREEGQDLVEYGLILALISIVAVASITAAGGAIRGFWEYIADQLGQIVVGG